MVDTFIVDAFTDRPFSGNPAAVCILNNGSNLSEDDMQKIAAEMNLSETAFLQLLTAEGDIDISSASYFSLRWFTPICEVKLCGHATLATAAVLFKIYYNTNTTLTFTTLSGDLKAVYNKDDGKITLNFPSAPPVPKNPSDYKELVQVVAGPRGVVDCQFSSSTRKLLLRLPDDTTRSQLESLSVDTSQLMKVNQNEVKGIIVTIKCSDDSEEGGYDFYSRYFAPWVGINEDPVTGSAHTVLGPYWSSILLKNLLTARQCSSRGGDLIVGINEDRVTLTGSAIIVLQGKMYYQ